MEVRQKISSPSELYHYGILGQKWGVRRYQNPDGSLTAAGQARYAYNERKQSLRTVSNMSSEDMQKAINRMNLERDYKRVTKENLKEARKDSNSKLNTAVKSGLGIAVGAGAALIIINSIKNGKKISEQYEALKKLTDSELTSKKVRLTLEKSVADLSKQQLNKGYYILNDVLKQSGATILATAVSGAAAYTLHSLIAGHADRETAAQFIAPNPKSKKK